MDGIPLTEPELPPIRQGSLEARIAVSDAEIDAAQSLRYQVFYEEMNAHPSAEVAARKRDFDDFDAHCDHLLVVHKDEAAGDKVIGTYRLLRRSVADRTVGFYSTDEYDIQPLVDYPGEILELGRSCVHPDFRSRPTMQLLWRKIAAYIFFYDVEIMFGCASLPGTDVGPLSDQLSYLYHYHLAPPALRPKALPERYVDMKAMPRADVSPRKSLAALPPLIKGYLRLGGFVGDGAVVDEDFNTTDVSIVVKTDLVTDKYVKHFQRENREAAED